MSTQGDNATFELLENVKRTHLMYKDRHCLEAFFTKHLAAPSSDTSQLVASGS